MPIALPKLLEGGQLKANRIKLLDQGFFKERVETGLDLLRNNKISGEKVVVKVIDWCSGQNRLREIKQYEIFISDKQW